MASETLPPVARKVYSLCKKCAVDRYHIVIAHVSSTTAKLQCEVCNAKSTWKLEGAKRKKATPDGTKPPSARLTGSEKRWRELRDKNNGSSSPYNMKAAFASESSIQHPKFGLGFVVGVTPQAIQVVFEDGERSLVHNRG